MSEIEKKKTINMPKKKQPIEAEMFSYEEYCVYELIKEKDKGISLFGPRFGVDTPFAYDLYAPDGIPSLGFIGKTAVEVKQHLSFATITETSSHYEKYGAEYNILVVYFKSSVSNYPSEKTNEQGKSFIYISFKELKDKYKKRTEKSKNDYYTERKNGDWKQEREELIKKAQEIVTQGSSSLYIQL